MTMKKRGKKVARAMAIIKFHKTTFECHSGRTKSDNSHSGNQPKHKHPKKSKRRKPKWKPKKK